VYGKLDVDGRSALRALLAPSGERVRDEDDVK